MIKKQVVSICKDNKLLLNDKTSFRFCRKLTFNIKTHNPQENIKARAAFAFLLDRVAQKKEIRNHSLGRRFCGLQKFFEVLGRYSIDWHAISNGAHGAENTAGCGRTPIFMEFDLRLTRYAVLHGRVYRFRLFYGTH